MEHTLPEPACVYGYTYAQIDMLVTDPERFEYWMRGQTVMLCPEHGMITYRDDLERYLRGGRVID